MINGKYSNEIMEKAKKIKLLLLDVDGVMTDGRIIIGNDGEEFKNFDVNDGLGIMLVKRVGLKCAILTAKGSRIVARRARDLRIDKVYKDFHYKIKALKPICRAFRVTPEEICFIGDDLIDVPLLKRVGLAVCPPNAMKDVAGIAHMITEKPGGRGAVREVCELLLKSQGKWEEATGRYFED
ncbi:MAG TPA: HAD hydrolase family protein [Candidatus Omnitrophota bacterium]|nr:HAD hydrolase family protein [Candidatus Omnitrophota bacterium]